MQGKDDKPENPDFLEVSKLNLRENKQKVPTITEIPVTRNTQGREGVEIMIHRREVQGKVDTPNVYRGENSTVDYTLFFFIRNDL